MMTKPTVICPGCTCLCDDIEVVDSDGLKIVNACASGKQWFSDGLHYANQPAQHRVDGQVVSLEMAIGAAKDILDKAMAPLVCGLDALNVDAQQEAWKLAKSIHGTIDTSLNNHGRAGLYSLQKHGKVTATIGEIANRSNLIVFWFCDPMATHPRLMERLKCDGKRVIVVDEAETATAKLADTFIELSPSEALSALMMLNAVVREKSFNLDASASTVGRDTLGSFAESLANELANSTYGAICYGHTTDDSQFDAANDQLALLVRALNLKTRFVSLSIRSDGNAQGAENVIAWSSGYPTAVNYARSMPRFNGNEFSAEQILRRGECDVVLLGPTSEAELGRLSKEANATLSRVATIELTSSKRLVSNAKVSIHVAAPGIDASGDFCRLDDVALPLTGLISTERPAAEEVLRQLIPSPAAD